MVCVFSVILYLFLNFAVSGHGKIQGKIKCYKISQFQFSLILQYSLIKNLYIYLIQNFLIRENYNIRENQNQEILQHLIFPYIFPWPETAKFKNKYKITENTQTIQFRLQIHKTYFNNFSQSSLTDFFFHGFQIKHILTITKMRFHIQPNFIEFQNDQDSNEQRMVLRTEDVDPLLKKLKKHKMNIHKIRTQRIHRNRLQLIDKLADDVSKEQAHSWLNWESYFIKSKYKPTIMRLLAVPLNVKMPNHQKLHKKLWKLIGNQEKKMARSFKKLQTLSYQFVNCLQNHKSIPQLFNIQHIFLQKDPWTQLIDQFKRILIHAFQNFNFYTDEIHSEQPIIGMMAFQLRELFNKRQDKLIQKFELTKNLPKISKRKNMKQQADKKQVDDFYQANRYFMLQYEQKNNK